MHRDRKPHHFGFWLFLTALLGPTLLLGLLLAPQYDYRLEYSTVHFWIVSLPMLCATGLGMLTVRIALMRRDGRALLIGSGFLAMALIFMIHAVGTPGVLFATTRIATAWSTPIALWVGGIFLCASTSDRLARQAWLIRRWPWLFAGGLLLWIGYTMVLISYVPGQSNAFQQQLLTWGQRWFPLVSLTTIGLYLWTALDYWRRWRNMPTGPLAALTIGALLLAQTALAAQYGRLWQLSFWLYHALLLVAIIILTYSALVGYERSGSLSSVVEGLLLPSTQRRQQAAFQQSMQMLLRALEYRTVQSLPDLRHELRQQFGLAEDQLNLLEEAVGLMASEREQSRRLEALADIGRNATLELTPEELIERALKALVTTTQARVAAIGLFDTAQTTLTFMPQHTWSGGTLISQTLTLAAAMLPLDWLSATDVPYDSQELPAELLALRPATDTTLILLPLAHRSGLLGVLAFQPAAAEQVNERLESVLQSIAAHIATAISNARLYSALQVEHTQLMHSEHSREQLTQMIVHDLKNPLTVIMSYGELLQRSDLTDDQRMLVQGTQRSSRTLLGLISDLLDSARLQTGQLQLQSVSVPVELLLQRSVVDLQPWASEDGQTLRINASGGWAIHIDAQLFERVLANLVSNAIKHTSASTQIEVGAAVGEDCITLWVRDNGPGIDPALLPQLFERFSSGVPRSSRQRNTGLGLHFCKLAVEAHGGTISVSSMPGQGTSFQISLPLSLLVPAAATVQG